MTRITETGPLTVACCDLIKSSICRTDSKSYGAALTEGGTTRLRVIYLRSTATFDEIERLRTSSRVRCET